MDFGRKEYGYQTSWSRSGGGPTALQEPYLDSTLGVARALQMKKPQIGCDGDDRSKERCTGNLWKCSGKCSQGQGVRGVPGSAPESALPVEAPT